MNQELSKVLTVQFKKEGGRDGDCEPRIEGIVQFKQKHRVSEWLGSGGCEPRIEGIEQF